MVEPGMKELVKTLIRIDRRLEGISRSIDLLAKIENRKARIPVDIIREEHREPEEEESDEM